MVMAPNKPVKFAHKKRAWTSPAAQPLAYYVDMTGAVSTWRLLQANPQLRLGSASNSGSHNV